MACLRCLLLSPDSMSVPLAEFCEQLDEDAPCALHAASALDAGGLSASEQDAALSAALQRLRQAGTTLRRTHSQLHKREREIADLRQAASRQELRLSSLEHLHQSSTQELERQLQIVQKQADEIRELSAPLIEVGAGVLAVPLIGRLDNERAAYLTQHLLSTVQTRRMRRVILDLTGLRGVDAQTAQTLLRIQRALALIGARVTLCGIGAPVAQVLALAGDESDIHPLHVTSTLRAAIQQG